MAGLDRKKVGGVSAARRDGVADDGEVLPQSTGSPVLQRTSLRGAEKFMSVGIDLCPRASL